uniref:Histidine kinase/HSP90-like ATPase domain-containing protein n=1 Tax=Aegilops tauschii subsp. strangulata TaxID=200361 RepID=A0A453LKM3_AEGTS
PSQLRPRFRPLGSQDTSMQSIKRLPRSVHSSLRSSIILSDLPRVVEELVYNSIDANARKIDVSVNVRACYVKVEDDGMCLHYVLNFLITGVCFYKTCFLLYLLQVVVLLEMNWFY